MRLPTFLQTISYPELRYFLQEHLKISFVEAVKMLANKYGIEIPDDSCSMDGDADQRKRESMLIINNYAAKYFAENLFNKAVESNKGAREEDS